MVDLPEKATNPQRLLLIEDNLDAAHTLTFLLRQTGHRVEFAINGYAALAIAEKLQPDVVLLDLGLPDFEGCSLIRRMRRFPHLASTRYIAISGRVGDDDRERALAAGCEAYLRKPVSVERLEAIIAGGLIPNAAESAAGRPLRGA
jgi:CheY-like chemotaxis protein